MTATLDRAAELAGTALDPPLAAAIDGLAESTGVPRTVVFLAAAQLLVRRYAGTEDVSIGVIARTGGTDRVLLRQDLSGDRSVSAQLDRVAGALTEALAHGSAPHREPAVLPPALPISVALDDPEFAPPRGELVIRVTGDTIRLLGYARSPAADLVPFLAEDLVTCLSELTAAPERPLWTVLERLAMERVVRAAPRVPACQDFVELGVDGLERSIPARFAELAAQWPDRVAVRADKDVLSYHELHAAATGIAEAIGRCGVGPGGRVGVLLGRHTRTVAAIMGVLISGNAYVPLDPSYPAERLRFMAGHANLGLLLIEPATAGLAAVLARANTLDVTAVGLREPAVRPGPAGPDSVAYVLYTSGSTGRPKGVQQSHRNVLFQVCNHINSHRIGPNDVVSVVSSFSFDASVTDLFTALMTGATAVLVDVGRHGFAHLAEVLTGTGVTVYHSTPTVYRGLLAVLDKSVRLESIRLVLLGGEELTPRDIRLYREHFGEHCVFVNGYGATEVSFACQHHLTHADPVPDSVVPVGLPLAGVDVVLLGDGDRPACLHGEILVRSEHVSVGYWDNPDANAASFMEWDGVRCYRTGDLGRRLPDGRIVFAGRADRQVKIRGNRVELGEIEAALSDEPSVARAAVVTRNRPGSSPWIVAYVVAAERQAVEPAALRERLTRRLPPFMVPGAVVELAALPLTPTGKVDARALPDPPLPAVGRDSAEMSTVDDEMRRMQLLVADAWRTVLGVPAAGLDQRFFDAGGDSLQAAAVAQRLAAELGTELPLYRLYEHPTVRSLARHLAGESEADSKALGLVAERMAKRGRGPLGRRRGAR